MKTRSRTRADQEEDQARLWPLSLPGPALAAVLAALPRPAKRCLRATCTAACTAVDASLTSLDATFDQALLPAAAPRLSRLQSLKCQASDPDDEVVPLLVALPLLPATLTQLELCIEDAPLPQGHFDALLAAVAARSSLESLNIGANTKRANSAALLTLGARLPALTDFRLTDYDYSIRGGEPVLQLPWHQLQKLRASVGLLTLLPQLLAREAPALRPLELYSDDPLDARALSGAPWFAQLTHLDLQCDYSAADLFAGAPAQLALQELRVCTTGNSFPLAAARRLAATTMPLRRLRLFDPAAGTVEAIAGAPWVSSLQALRLRGADDFGTLAAAAAAAAALAAAPLGALTSLELTHVALGPDAVPLSRLLSARWAHSLRQLVFRAYISNAAPAAAAVAALAAAPLPALRVLGLQRLCLDAAALSGALAAAPWLQRLEELTLEDTILSLEAFAALAALQLPTLAQLYLHSGSLSAPALEALAAAPWLPRLQRLRLGGHVPAAAHRACLAELSKACSPFSALLARGGEIDMADVCIFERAVE